MPRSWPPYAAALVVLALAFAGGAFWKGKDAAALNATIDGLKAEKGTLEKDLADTIHANAKTVAASDSRYTLLAEKAAFYKASAETRGERAKVLETAPLDTGKALDLGLSRYGWTDVKRFQGGYFFTEFDAGRVLRLSEKYENCLETGKDLAGEAISLRGQLVEAGIARDALQGNVAALQGYKSKYQNLVDRGEGEYRDALSAERRKVFWWRLVAGAAVGGALYSAASN